MQVGKVFLSLAVVLGCTCCVQQVAAAETSIAQLKADCAQALCDVVMFAQVKEVYIRPREKRALYLCVPQFAALAQTLAAVAQEAELPGQLTEAREMLEGVLYDIRQGVHNATVNETCVRVPNPFHFFDYTKTGVHWLTIHQFPLVSNDFAEGMSKVRDLEIKNCDLKINAPALLGDNGLESIIIERCELGADSLKWVAAAQGLSNLTLNLCTGGLVLPDLSNTALSHFTVEGCHLQKDSLAVLSAVTSLKNLVLNGCSGTDDLPDFSKTGLTGLSVIRCTLSGDVLEKAATARQLTSFSLLHESLGAAISVPQNFAGLSKLEEFSLMHQRVDLNSLTNLAQLKGLKKISLISCGDLAGFPRIAFVERPGNLEIELSSSDFVPVDQGAIANVLTSPHVHTCRLQNCGLRDFPELDGGQVSVKELDLSNNRLTEQGLKNVCRLRSLEILTLTSNQLTKLPDDINNLENLLFLEARDNKLTELPANLSNLKKLGSIDVGNNRQLANIPDTLVQSLPQLQFLMLDGTRVPRQEELQELVQKNVEKLEREQELAKRRKK